MTFTSYGKSDLVGVIKLRVLSWRGCPGGPLRAPSVITRALRNVPSILGFLLAVPYYLPWGGWLQEPRLTKQDHFPGAFYFDLPGRKGLLSGCSQSEGCSLERPTPIHSVRSFNTHVDEYLLRDSFCSRHWGYSGWHGVPVLKKKRNMVIQQGKSGNCFRLPWVLCSDRKWLRRESWQRESFCVRTFELRWDLDEWEGISHANGLGGSDPGRGAQVGMSLAVGVLESDWGWSLVRDGESDPSWGQRRMSCALLHKETGMQKRSRNKKWSGESCKHSECSSSHTYSQLQAHPPQIHEWENPPLYFSWFFVTKPKRVVINV